MMRPLIILAFLLISHAAFAKSPEPSARQILERAFEAQGGAAWAQVRTLKLSGHAIFYPKGTHENPLIAERYIMLREFDPGREIAHGPDGKIRIEYFSNATPVFQVAYDGSVTTTEKGEMPAADADKFWASNFGFGIIRQALKPGFILTRLPNDKVDGFSVYMLKITDPKGQDTLFGFDQKTHYIRRAGFMTPRGWHERTYTDFMVLKKPRWVQARHIRLTYNGVLANELFWRDVKINEVMPTGSFRISAIAK
jgi:hypothetical protein